MLIDTKKLSVAEVHEAVAQAGFPEIAFSAVYGSNVDRAFIEKVEEPLADVEWIK